jgi:dTDP-4-amino-4,6-dideoxygalactose transaminase
MNEHRPPKEVVIDLAKFGGTPIFGEERHVGMPNIGERQKFMDRVNEAFDRRWLTNDGPMVREFEERIASLTDSRHCVVVSSGTMGLEVAARALGLAGEVIVPAFTFVATAHALQWIGLRPVLCEVRSSDFTIDVESAARLVTPETSGIVGVHLWGRPADVDGLEALAAENQIGLLFDAAHAIGCSSNGRPIGRFGRAEVFSFHATKVVNSFEGGAIVTNDDQLADRMRLMRNFGFAGVDSIASVGTNAKMSEVSAAMGLTSLESFDNFVRVNNRNFDQYRAGLSGVPGIDLLEFDTSDSPNYQYAVALVNPDFYGLDADELVSILHGEGVLARRYFKPGLHRMEPYRSTVPPPGPFPIAEMAADRAVVFPTGTAVSGSDVKAIAGLVEFVGLHRREIRARLDNRRNG